MTDDLMDGRLTTQFVENNKHFPILIGKLSLRQYIHIYNLFVYVIHSLFVTVYNIIFKRSYSEIVPIPRDGV